MDKLILTEQRNLNTKDIDLLSTREIVELINLEDYKVAESVNKELDNIAKAVDLIENGFLNNGHLLYFGAGTSGRLGILDASECPPTFGVSPKMVRGYIAGGKQAITAAVEGAEDSLKEAYNDFKNANTSINDVVVVISASGNAPYIIEILNNAKEKGLKTIALTCNKNAKVKDLADVFISPEVGPEVVTGSTRMKSGTAQKMVLNMLTTASMIRIGKTYENFMIDVQPTNQKLKDRAKRIVSELTGVDVSQSERFLIEASYDVKVAVVMIKNKCTKQDAQYALIKNNGVLRKTLSYLNV